MATPLAGNGVLALMPQEVADSAAASSSSPSASSPESVAAAADKKLAAVDGGSAEKWPILIFLYFHKAIRAQLDRLHRAAVKFATDGSGDVQSLAERCRFVYDVYKHHCNAEDAVIFPALDIRVKNVARTYSLEHEGERDLFDKLIETFQPDGDYDKFRRELASWTGAIQRLLSQHMSKEEEQVFPLLIEKFSFEEQAVLVWRFLCSIPVNTMTEFLPHLSTCISVNEHRDLINCLCKIVPMEKLLQQVIFSWFEDKGTTNMRLISGGDLESHDCQSLPSADQIENHDCSSEKSGTGKRKHKESDFNIITDTGVHPIDEILHWHNAIRKELNDITKEARKIQLGGEFSDLSTFNMKLQFIADVCIFHSIAEDEVIFPAVNVSYTEEHKEEASQLRRLIEEIQNARANSTSAEFYSNLCSQADHIVETILKHFHSEEDEVLPLARKKFSPQKQRKLLFKSICVMPLKLLECVLPWFVAKLSDEEARSFLRNIHLAASPSEAALVTLFSGWACNSRRGKDISDSGKFTCLTPKETGCCSLEDNDEPQEDGITAYCACACPLSSTKKFSARDCNNSGRPVKRGNFAQPSGHNEHNKSNIYELGRSSCGKTLCCVPGLGVASSNVGVSSLAATRSLCSLSYNSSTPSLNSSLFDGDTDFVSSSTENTVRPIDTIFKFHKAIRKDVTYLDDESGKLIHYEDASLREFDGRFRLLWGLYKGHSNAEDDIVFPALESRETLHNVSHSYTLDHKQEEKLFEDISKILSELSHLHDGLHTTINENGVNRGDLILPLHEADDGTRRWNEHVTELQGMCRSLNVTLDNHVSREELELWPLFDKHFSVEEQDKLVGQIIGMTGAEVLQSMLPWVTSALELEEQNEMMDTWRQAAKNTMFNEWLNEWWEGTPIASQAAKESLALPEGSYYQESLDQSDQMFKPGWKDIFRMNQNELESEIRKVSRDAKLDPRRKAYLIQNLMTSRWIAAQQKLTKARSSEVTDGEKARGNCSSFRDPEKEIFGCEHYKRNCKLLAVCCKKLFACRFCHDKISDHAMDRKATSEMMCMQCLKVQPIGPTCKTPTCGGFSMAKYYCSICKFFDDERMVYHCPFCNLCRVGKGLGIDFFHCMKCNCCLGLKLLDHKCREKSLETNCPICCDFLFTSSEAVRALPCGHYMHSACFQAYTCTHYTCPICCRSLGDMAVYFGMLDALLAAEELPEEYRNRCQDILCNDCDKKGISRFHWLYHKCGFCGSYNTRVIKIDSADCSTSSQ